MSTTAEALLAPLLALPEQDRLMIADRLKKSVFDKPQLEAPADEDLDDGIKATLDRRWEEIVSGKVKCEDAFVVLERIKRRHLERVGAAS